MHRPSVIRRLSLYAALSASTGRNARRQRHSAAPASRTDPLHARDNTARPWLECVLHQDATCPRAVATAGKERQRHFVGVLGVMAHGMRPCSVEIRGAVAVSVGAPTWLDADAATFA